jgi:hypothetical protein
MPAMPLPTNTKRCLGVVTGALESALLLAVGCVVAGAALPSVEGVCSMPVCTLASQKEPSTTLCTQGFVFGKALDKGGRSAALPRHHLAGFVPKAAAVTPQAPAGRLGSS